VTARPPRSPGCRGGGGLYPASDGTLHTRALTLALVLGATAGSALAHVPAGPAWPSRPIRIIVPSGPVGPSDFLARTLAIPLAEQLRQSVMIDNRPGAGGTLGSTLAARAAPDGHTLLVMGLSNYVINATLYPKQGFDPRRDMTPLSVLAEAPLLIAAHPSLPARNIAELVALARKPGRGLDYASGGSGTGPHLAMELFLERTGTKIAHIPYKGAGAALNDVIAGQVGLTMVNMTAGLPFVRSGKLVAIAVTSARRAPGAPEIPTVAESGYPDFIATGQHVALIPAATPRSIAVRLQVEFSRALALPEVRDRLATEGAEVVASSTEHASTYVLSEIDRWAKVIRRLGLTPG